MNKKITLIILALILIIIASISVGWFDPTSIENNTTIELDGVTITVPASNNYTINDSYTMGYFDVHVEGKTFNPTENDNFCKEGKAHEYYDLENNLRVVVVDSVDAPYLAGYPDGTCSPPTDDNAPVYQGKGNVGDKVVVAWDYGNHGEYLVGLIVGSAV